MIPPVDSAVFVHSRRQTKDSEDFSKRATTHYHVKINKVSKSVDCMFYNHIIYICIDHYDIYHSDRLSYR